MEFTCETLAMLRGTPLNICGRAADKARMPAATLHARQLIAVFRHSRQCLTGCQNSLSSIGGHQPMAHKFVSRRHFIEKSVTTGLAVGLGLKIDPLHGSASSSAPKREGLTLKVSGDVVSGYGAVLLHDGRPILRHSQGGEFSALFQNEERSV